MARGWATDKHPNKARGKREGGGKTNAQKKADHAAEKENPTTEQTEGK